MTFFDKLSSKTKELTDSAKLSLKLSEEKRKLPELYERLGQFVFTRYSRGEAMDAACAPILRAIDEVKANIDAIVAELSSIRAANEKRVICPMCGAVNGACERCSICGSELSAGESRRDCELCCPECGETVPAGAVRCPVCDASLSDD